MTNLLADQLPSSALALITTVHTGFVLLLHHRIATTSRHWLLLLPAVVLVFFPWVMPEGPAVAAGLGLQLGWFVAVGLFVAGPPAGNLRGLDGPGKNRTVSPPGSAAAALPQRPSPPSTPVARPQGPASVSKASAQSGFVPLTVLAVRSETPTIRTFRIERPKDFAFEAGQFLTVRVQVDDKTLVRCYSISSAPETPGYLEISVRRQGVVSGALHATLRQGSTIWVRPPAGRFVYPEGDDRPIVLVAGGVGITPLMSMLRHSVAARPHRPVTLLYSVRTSADIAFRAELAAIASVHPQAGVLITVTEESVTPPLLNGRICPAFLQAHIVSPLDSVFCLCGPGVMIDDTARAIRSLGVLPPQIRWEVFQPAAAIGAVAAPVAEALSAEAPDPGSVSPSVATTRALTLTRSNRTIQVPAGATLLEAAESAGAHIPSICRSGVCTTCRTRLVSGEARCTSEALPEADREAGFVLPCVSWALSDVGLEA